MLKHLSKENLTTLKKALGKEPIGEILGNAFNKLRGKEKILAPAIINAHYSFDGLNIHIAQLYYKNNEFQLVGYIDSNHKLQTIAVRLSEKDKHVLKISQSDRYKIGRTEGMKSYEFKGKVKLPRNITSIDFEVKTDKEHRLCTVDITKLQNYGNIDTHNLKFYQDAHPKYYREASSEHLDKANNDTELFCFYLPQFHRIKENDEWWGKGFTEWHNVAKALPKFEYHYQPRLPGELGYYDLNNPEILERQSAMAKQYGIDGFCFHYYWFSGKRLLEMPLDQFLNNKQIDFKFCLNWANENWTRAWDGSETEILIKQDYSIEQAVQFYKDISVYFHDERYRKIDGKPVFLVYRPLHAKNIKEWIEVWRKEAKKDGFEDLFIIGCQSIEYIKNPDRIGLDMTVQFPPHHMGTYNDRLRKYGYDNTFMLESLPHTIYNHSFNGLILNYSSVVACSYDYEGLANEIESIFPMWDNTARKDNFSTPFAFSNPDKYGTWLSNVLARSSTKKHPFVFINAWNEWAEGAYLEPDRHFGYAYLQKTAEVVSYYSTNESNREKFRPGGIVKEHKIAIILHLYYIDMWEEIRDYFKKLDYSFDLYVSIIQHNEPFKQQILEDYPSANVFVFQNQGRDVGPFLEIMNNVRLLDYEYVLKIHSKKSPHAKNGDEWRNYSYESLMGSNELVNDVINAFEADEKLGVVTGFKNVFSFKKWGLGSNEQPMKELSALLGIEKDFKKLQSHCLKHEDEQYGDWEENLLRFNTEKDILSHRYLFPAGTMFWFKPKALKGLLDVGWGLNDFPTEAGQLDGTMAHAIERMIGLITTANGYSISYVDKI